MQKIVSRWSSVSFHYILTKKEEYFEISSKDKVGILIEGAGNISLKISGGYISLLLPGKVGDKLNITFTNNLGHEAIVDYNFFVKKLGIISWIKRFLCKR